MKILCLGNNTQDTDTKTRRLAQAHGAQCHGLLSELSDPITPHLISGTGYYHSSVYDIEFGRLVEVAGEFDKVIILDQTKDEYSHPDAFYKTIKLAKQIKHTVEVEYIDASYATNIDFFENLVQENKSFCIFPFIELLVNNKSTTVCCRSSTPVTRLDELKDFATDPHYQAIRHSMLSGELVPAHCSSCYRLEQRGITSARQQETVEWANRLNLASLEDLSNIRNPAYYEVRPSNVCNLQCRMCNPASSHLIAAEYKKLNFSPDLDRTLEYTNFDFVDFTNLKKLYVAGGEPTAMPEFYDFLDQCIASGNTDFEFVVNTNATKINSRFQRQLQHFSNFQFIVSIDGVGDLNHYIRWPSTWDTIVDNVRLLTQLGHVVSFNTAVTIYNVSRLHDLLSFFDREFPGRLVHCAPSPADEVHDPFNFPNAELVLPQLQKITELRCYKNSTLLASLIDKLTMHYTQVHQVDQIKLKDFFKFNDALDQSRRIKLIDYISELELARPN